MINKENRLKKNKHFVYIYKNGECKHSKGLSMVFLKTKFNPYKVGFSVSKKIGNSVQRNKVKRRLRECFKTFQQFINEKNNYVFIAKEGIEKMNFFEIKNSMKSLLEKANVLKK